MIISRDVPRMWAVCGLSLSSPRTCAGLARDVAQVQALQQPSNPRTCVPPSSPRPHVACRRFKHINNAARDLLAKHGFTEHQMDEKKTSKKSK
jgi:hypothetical protein